MTRAIALNLQLYHKILLVIAIISFLAELAEMVWLALDWAPPVGNYGCDAMSAAVILNSLVVIVELTRVGVAALIFQLGKMVEL